MNIFLKEGSYIGDARYNPDTKNYNGKLLNIKDLVTFEGSDFKELKKDFKQSIKNYIEECKKANKKPQKPTKHFYEWALKYCKFGN